LYGRQKELVHPYIISVYQLIEDMFPIRTWDFLFPTDALVVQEILTLRIHLDRKSLNTMFEDGLCSNLNNTSRFIFKVVLNKKSLTISKR
jgi:hypothetical protein